MNVIVLLLLDIFFKLITSNKLFFLLPILLIFFLNNSKNFLLTFFLSSFINDFMINLPIGLTGLTLGSFFVFLIILKKFININSKNSVYFINIILQLLFWGVVFYFLKLNSLSLFLSTVLLNIIFSTFLIFLYRLIY